MMNQYRVNINDLFDCDEEFLYDNEDFRAYIRKVYQQFEYLVNPVYEIEDLITEPDAKIDQKYAEKTE